MQMGSHVLIIYPSFNSLDKILCFYQFTGREVTSLFITISDTEQQLQKCHGILESALRNFSINARNNIIFEYLTLTQAI